MASNRRDMGPVAAAAHDAEVTSTGSDRQSAIADVSSTTNSFLKHTRAIPARSITPVLVQFADSTAEQRCVTAWEE
jgi:hypothetical protein